jgi:CheY-like chemotaxis protein/HPt (histidine-containing phosphotransfer) domain-containing protein
LSGIKILSKKTTKKQNKTKVIVQGFRQLLHGPLRKIRGFSNLLAYQEVSVTLALQEMQEANDELSFHHLENNKTFQAQLESKPDEPFEIRELVDRVISFVMSSLLEPNLDILYHYTEALYAEGEHHYRIGNKAAITSLIFNFILYRATNTHLNQQVPDSVRHVISFDISDTSTGIEFTQKVRPEGNPHANIEDTGPISHQLVALVELTHARLQYNVLEIPIKTSIQRSRARFPELSSKIISSNSLRFAAFANRLDDFGLKIVADDEPANCYFVDAENQTLLQAEIDRLATTATVFLFNSRNPTSKRNGTHLKYPIRHSELLFELTQVSLLQSRSQNEGTHVMVVDDNPQNLRLVVKHLESLGIRSTSATNGSEAIALYGEHIDLIFMDLHMPGMSGFETALVIRSSTFPKAPIVALSADLSADDIAQALVCGINGIFEKPIDRLIIEQALIQHVDYTPEDFRPTKPPTTQSRKPPNRINRVGTPVIFDIDLSLARADNRADIAKEMMQMLIESLPTDIAKLNAQDQLDDYISMSEVTHRMKGACCYCGVPKFEDSIKKLHLLLKSNQALAEQDQNEQTRQGIKSLVLVINRDATDLIQWHIKNTDPFINQQINQEPKSQ